MGSTIVLVNANRIRPPIAPIGLECLASAAEDAGLGVRVVDLAWSVSVVEDLRLALGARPRLVGLTLRNLDDSSSASRVSFIAEQRAIVAAIRAATDAPIVVGGAGLSIAPAAALSALGADFAVRGEGEAALPLLADALERRGALERVPGLVWALDGRVRENPGRWIDLAALSAPRRRFVANVRYLREGAQIGFETSRGCGAACTYCADPVAKGRLVRKRSPASVADEVQALSADGLDLLHTCDSELNADPRHALEISQALEARRLGERVRWYAYCTPLGFTGETARAMRRAGCAGINFGIDHVDAARLACLGRAHRLADVERARDACREAGIPVMFDLLLGAPGESRDTIRQALAAMRALDPAAVGVALGLRLYRGTALADRVAPAGSSAQDGVSGATPALLDPAFFVEPALGADVEAWLADEVGDDPRFFFLGPADGNTELASYNYNANAALEQAIARGARGAYWHILRSLRGLS
jgi:radical SAM superfamily enzyme YgiQ (UPF0313 family)